MSQTSTTISVGGKEYRIASESSPEQVQRMAAYLDERLRRVNQENVGINGYVAMMLTALNIVEDYMEAVDRIDNMEIESENEAYRQETEELKQKISDLQRENEILRSGIGSRFARKLG